MYYRYCFHLKEENTYIGIFAIKSEDCNIDIAWYYPPGCSWLKPNIEKEYLRNKPIEFWFTEKGHHRFIEEREFEEMILCDPCFDHMPIVCRVREELEGKIYYQDEYQVAIFL